MKADAQIKKNHPITLNAYKAKRKQKYVKKTSYESKGTRKHSFFDKRAGQPLRFHRTMDL